MCDYYDFETGTMERTPAIGDVSPGLIKWGDGSVSVGIGRVTEIVHIHKLNVLTDCDSGPKEWGSETTYDKVVKLNDYPVIFGLTFGGEYKYGIWKDYDGNIHVGFGNVKVIAWSVNIVFVDPLTH